VDQGYKGIKRTAGFEKLWIWQESKGLMLEIANICQTLPRDERFRLRDQVERSSSSVSDNIAEGYTAYYYNDKIKGMYTARKEAGETQNHVRKMEGRKYIPSQLADDLVSWYERVIIGLNNFISFIAEKRDASAQKGERNRASRGPRQSS